MRPCGDGQTPLLPCDSCSLVPQVHTQLMETHVLPVATPSRAAALIVIGMHDGFAISSKALLTVTITSCWLQCKIVGRMYSFLWVRMIWSAELYDKYSAARGSFRDVESGLHVSYFPLRSGRPASRNIGTGGMDSQLGSGSGWSEPASNGLGSGRGGPDAREFGVAHCIWIMERSLHIYVIISYI
jgi:hypothetical protein